MLLCQNKMKLLRKWLTMMRMNPWNLIKMMLARTRVKQQVVHKMRSYTQQMVYLIQNFQIRANSLSFTAYFTGQPPWDIVTAVASGNAGAPELRWRPPSDMQCHAGDRYGGGLGKFPGDKLNQGQTHEEP